VALLTAMLVVALATTAAVAMVSRQQFDIRRTSNLLQAEQAYLYVLGVDDWAAQILRRDRKDNAIDHANEEWATILPPIPVDGGQVGGAIEDRQGCFNLNDLVNGGVADSAAIERFRRLLSALSLDTDLAMVAADWLDADIDATFPGGAEDDNYLQRERPYRTANAGFVSVSELRLLEGVDKEVYTELSPHVCVLPTRVAINVNTATAQVLMSLANGISEADAEVLIEGRGDEGYADADAFLKEKAIAGRKVPKDLLGVQSNYFVVTSQVMFGRITVSYQSMIQRSDTGETRILMRAQGTL
jgi:general secretion pathway protein K